MRIACPACAAEYEVPDRLLAGGPRKLRCSRCAAEFVLPQPPPPPLAPPEAEPPPAPAAPPPEPPAAVAPAPEPQPEPAPVPAPPEPLARALKAREAADVPSRALRGAWVASIAAVVLGIAALLLFRASVMEAWPASTRLFAALGLA